MPRTSTASRSKPRPAGKKAPRKAAKKSTLRATSASRKATAKPKLKARTKGTQATATRKKKPKAPARTPRRAVTAPTPKPTTRAPRRTRITATTDLSKGLHASASNVLRTVGSPGPLSDGLDANAPAQTLAAQTDTHSPFNAAAMEPRKPARQSSKTATLHARKVPGE
jgi:hypothetical protein